MHSTLKACSSTGLNGGAGDHPPVPIALSEPEMRKALGNISAGTIAVWRRKFGLPFLQFGDGGRVVYPYALALQWAAENATRLHGEADDRESLEP